MLTLYGHANTRSTRVTWALEEAGADYQFLPISLALGQHKSAEFLSINPYGKIPVLVDDTLEPPLVLTESVAICHYLGERFPDSALIPPISQPLARARYFQWCFFAISELEAPLWSAARNTRLYEDDRKIPAVAANCAWEFKKTCKILSLQLHHHPYVAGEQFTAADIVCTTLLHWAPFEKFTLSQDLIAYHDRLSTRPALLRARQREAEASATGSTVG